MSGLHHCAWGCSFDVCGKCLHHERGAIAIRAAFESDPNQVLALVAAGPVVDALSSDQTGVLDAVFAAAVNHALADSEPPGIWHARLLPRALAWIDGAGARRGLEGDDRVAASLRLMRLATKQLDLMTIERAGGVQCQQYVVLKQKNNNVCGYHALFNASCMLEVRRHACSHVRF